MKFLGCFLGTLAILAIAGGAIALSTGFPNSGTPSAEPTIASGDSTSTSTATVSLGTANPETTAQDRPTLNPSVLPSQPVQATATPAISHVDVGQPSMEVPTFPLGSVQATFTEEHQFGLITVSFRPGAYSVEHASMIAGMTVEAMAEANAKLGTNWSEDMTVFLADQLFAEDCLGCQGFTESNFRWIFMLDDGSVVQDEFEALLVHEMTHMIAGNEIHLPFDIFYVEGLAMWVMTDDLLRYGYVSPQQSTAWVYGAGALPSLQEIMNDDFAGRMRKRVYYDAAGSFAFFVIETYGWDSYISLYKQNPLETVLGKPLETIEAEWHAYLEADASATIGGTDATAWWNAASQVIDAYGRFYENTDGVSADQYRLLTLSRLALNRADTGNALEYLSQSGI